MSKQYDSIDLMKFIFCLCIIGIHTNISSIFPKALQLLIGRGFFRLAVPFFFVCSGFWIGKKYLKQPAELDIIIQKYIFRLLIPLIIFENINNLLEIIYAFLTIFLYLLKCPQSLILSALRAFCFCGKPHISRSIFLYFRYQTWLKSW